MVVDEIQIGTVRTYAANTWVTDSAASGTAYAAGVKTNNGFISMTSDGKKHATVLEAANEKGMNTALVVTSRITHATPAVFSAHIDNRDMENEIAEQQIEHDVKILFGGGRQHFIPKREPGSTREDERNLLQEARGNGFNVITEKAEFESLALSTCSWSVTARKVANFVIQLACLDCSGCLICLT